jgi:hypothetical protein
VVSMRRRWAVARSGGFGCLRGKGFVMIPGACLPLLFETINNSDLTPIPILCDIKPILEVRAKGDIYLRTWEGVVW